MAAAAELRGIPGCNERGELLPSLGGARGVQRPKGRERSWFQFQVDWERVRGKGGQLSVEAHGSKQFSCITPSSLLGQGSLISSSFCDAPPKKQNGIQTTAQQVRPCASFTAATQKRAA